LFIFSIRFFSIGKNKIFVVVVVVLFFVMIIRIEFFLKKRFGEGIGQQQLT
jgi:hypothetical protein